MIGATSDAPASCFFPPGTHNPRACRSSLLPPPPPPPPLPLFLFLFLFLPPSPLPLPSPRSPGAVPVAKDGLRGRRDLSAL